MRAAYGFEHVPRQGRARVKLRHHDARDGKPRIEPRAGTRPRREVALAWRSTSTSMVGWPTSAIAAARLIAVVVLPTPPFWLTTASTGGDGVANMLGLAWLTDPISGAIGRDSSPGSGA